MQVSEFTAYTIFYRYLVQGEVAQKMDGNLARELLLPAITTHKYLKEEFFVSYLTFFH